MTPRYPLRHRRAAVLAGLRRGVLDPSRRPFFSPIPPDSRHFLALCQVLQAARLALPLAPYVSGHHHDSLLRTNTPKFAIEQNPLSNRAQAAV